MSRLFKGKPTSTYNCRTCGGQLYISEYAVTSYVRLCDKCYSVRHKADYDRRFKKKIEYND